MERSGVRGVEEGIGKGLELSGGGSWRYGHCGMVCECWSDWS